MDYPPESVISCCLCLVLITTWLYYYSTSTFDYWKVRGVKYVNPLPFIGTARNILQRAIPSAIEFDRVYREYVSERFVGLFLFRRPVLLLRDPDLINAVLVTDFFFFTDRNFFTNEKIDKLSSHLLGLTGTRWKNLRRKLTPVFTSGKLKTMMDELKSCTDELNTALDREVDDVDIQNLMTNFTTRVIGSVAFGCQFNAEESNFEFLKRAQTFFTFSLRTVLVAFLDTLSPKFRNFLGIKLMAKENEDFYLNFVRDTIEYREQNNVCRNDFLQLLINLRKEDASRSSQDQHDEDELILDDKLLASNVFIFFIAGYETTASTLSYCLLELAANTRVQDTLREETVTALKKNNYNLTYDVLEEMKYMEKVLSETLRKYPIVVGVGRVCGKQYKFPESDLVVDAGTRVVVPVYSIHKDPQYYPRPEEFDPERFSEENKQSRRKGTYLPFGDGPRKCIGIRFAILEMKVALASLISRYRFTMANRMTYPVEFSAKSVFLKPKDGVWLRIQKIKQE